MNVIGENMSANIGRQVVAAVEARIRIQIEPLEVAIQIDLDVPHLVLGQPIALRKALSTLILSQYSHLIRAFTTASDGKNQTSGDLECLFGYDSSNTVRRRDFADSFNASWIIFLHIASVNLCKRKKQQQ
jgi:hypothetical protein